MNDLTGKKFGRLTVLERNGSSKDKRAMWLCKCECGKYVTVIGKSLTDGKTKSCGCLFMDMRHDKAESLVGQKFGRLTVICKDKNCIYPSGSQKIRWKCKCECGKVITVLGTGLKSGKTKSCGCLQRELLSKRVTTHGKTDSRLYIIWCGMKYRCYNPNCDEYKNYGGRGIIICDEWLDDFQTFYDWAISNGYGDDLTIERKNVNGNYEPLNCCWITKRMQSRNRTDSHRITCNGITMILTDWADALGISRSALKYRIKNSGISEEKVIENLLKESEALKCNSLK